jgi:hypothetical protein
MYEVYERSWNTFEVLRPDKSVMVDTSYREVAEQIVQALNAWEEIDALVAYVAAKAQDLTLGDDLPPLIEDVRARFGAL